MRQQNNGIKKNSQKKETYQTHKISEEMSQSEESLGNSCNSSLVQKISLMKQNIKKNTDQDVEIITNKEFQSVRNLVRPHQCIVYLCRALVTLLQLEFNQNWPNLQKTMLNIKNIGQLLQQVKINELNQTIINKAQNHFDQSKESQFEYYEKDNINKEIFSFIQKANSFLYKIINEFIQYNIETQEVKLESKEDNHSSQMKKSPQKLTQNVVKKRGIIDSILSSKNIEDSNHIDYEKLSRNSKSIEKLYASRYDQVMNIRVKKPLAQSKIKLHQSMCDFNINHSNDIQSQIKRSQKTQSKIKGEITKTWHLFEKENLMREKLDQKQKEIQDIEDNLKLNQQLQEQLKQKEKSERNDIMIVKEQSIQDLRKYKLIKERKRLEQHQDDIKIGEKQSLLLKQDKIKAKEEKRALSVEKKQQIIELRKEKSKEKKIYEHSQQLELDFNYQQSLKFKQKQVLSEEDKLQKQLQKSLQLIKSLRKK